MKRLNLTVLWTSLLLAFIFTPLSQAKESPPPIPPELLAIISAQAGDRPVLIGDTRGGVIRYLLPEPAQVKLLICAKPGARPLHWSAGEMCLGGAIPVLRTLIDWEERSAGLNIEPWDGKDSGGHPIDPDRYVIKISLRPLDAPSRPLKFRIVSPKTGSTLSGRVNVRVELDKYFRGYRDEAGKSRYRFGILLNHYPQYTDQEVLSKGGGTFIWPWDTTTVPNGEHIFTFNICDHHDQVGVDTIKVNVQN